MIINTIVNRYFVLAGLLAVCLSSFSHFVYGDSLPANVTGRLETASANFAQGALAVSTGRIARTWRWTGKGLVTVGLRDVTGNTDRIARSPAHACDWDLPGAISDKSQAELLSVTIQPDDDEGFSGKHLEVVSTIRYPAAKLAIQHVVWVFPDAPGLRVQLRAKALPGFNPKQVAAGADRLCQSYGGTLLAPGPRIDYLPLDFSLPNCRRYWGLSLIHI